jgi:hypothetical protein
MKPTDVSFFDLHHLPPCDPERHVARRSQGRIKYTRIQVPVDRPTMCAAPPVNEGAEAQPVFDLDILRLETLRQRNRSEARGLDALVDIERARRALDKDAKIGVVVVVRDPATFEAINFPGQVETFTPEGRCKKLDHGNWIVELLYLDDTADAEDNCGGRDGDPDGDYGMARGGIFTDAAG